MNAFSASRFGKAILPFSRKSLSSTARVVAMISLAHCIVGNLHAQITYTILHSFTNGDGSSPRAALLRASDGYFYGTTSSGGSGVSGPAGTIFRVGSDGSFSNLFTFSFQVTGDSPYGGLIEGNDGYLYGTTRGSGSYDGNIFKIAKDGSGFSILHTLTGYFGNNDGAHPECNLLSVGGYLYGTTFDDGAGGYGTAFRITPDGLVFTNLESLPGRSPAALTAGSDGNLYGITAANIFRVTSSNTALAVYTFQFSTDGSSPSAALVKGADGYLYGTTSAGGAHSSGTVFRFDGSGGYTNLHAFDTSVGEGSGSSGALLLGSDGNFYGTTPNGGTNSVGAVFRMSPDGTFSNIYDFAFSSGCSPSSGLVQGSDGSFYGTTFQGGSNSVGTVFELTVPLASPANRIPSFGLSTSNVLITISTVAGEKYQLQTNGSIFSNTWANVGGPFVGIGGPQTVTNPIAPSLSHLFYRFQISP